MALLDHETLAVYQRSMEFLAFACRVVAQLPPGAGEIRERIERAALAIPWRIAEGVDQPNPQDRAELHASARGSAMECAALLEGCRTTRVIRAGEVGEGMVLLLRVAALLTPLCQG